MWVSKKTRYGLRLLIELAVNNKSYVSLKDISKNEGISNKFLERIVSRLKKAGFVESERGPVGGYRLKKDPKEITLKEVIDLFEGNEALVECLIDPLLCERSGFCKSRSLWKEADKKINEALQSIKLTDIIEKASLKAQKGR